MIREFHQISLRGRNSFGVDQRAARLVEFETAEDLRTFFAAGIPGRWTVLAGGNNILFTEDYDGVLLTPVARQIALLSDDGDEVRLRVEAGVEWDDLVEWAVERGLWGIENLSLIPGKAGSAPVQNIGAYGCEAKDAIRRVEMYCVETGNLLTLDAAHCGFGYRESVFKHDLKGRVIITAIEIRLSHTPRPKLGYGDVEREVEARGGATLRNIREAICSIRRAKLPDPAVLGNAGSFFKNPVVEAPVAERLLAEYPDMPHYAAPEGRVKLAAGWLIDRAGMKGYREGSVGVHERQALVLVNHGGATGGEVLALASYPTYDLSTFNEDYDELVNDQRLPMFNRATQGIYAPGSTFKMVTAVAALESGIITPSSIIQDRGIYTYYKDPQPMCWIYSQTGSTHGRINVSQAITDSCNYFFYEVGRLTGIRTLDSYASQFGLGQSTGIEIGDSSGVLASPEWAESHDQEGTDGQTITAAIGQSYNLFTPLQLANYVATLVGGGDHYQAHLLKNVKAYDNSRLLYMYGDKPMNTVEISDSTLSAVTKGMHELTVSGSVAYAFENCVVSAGAKTGSAQVGTDIANGVFVAYAPYENPEIAVAIVIEKGGSGAALANTAVEIINSWFSRAQDGTAIGENTLLK